MKYSISQILTLLFLVQLASVGCKKSSMDPVCKPIDYPKEPRTGYGYEYGFVGRVMRSPYFNPANDEEIVFWNQEPTGETDTLFVYNLRTQQMTKLLEMKLRYPPKWGRNGWILLGIRGGNIGMIKPNGDSLTDISKGKGSYHHPTWNFSGSLILAQPFSESAVMMTADYAIIDTLPLGGGDSHFIDDDRVIYAGQWAGVYTISTNIDDRIAYSSMGSGHGGRMISDDEFIWSDEEGIYKTSIATRQTTTIKKSCDSRLYWGPTVNSSRTKVLWTRVDKWFAGKNTVYSDYEIVEMNIDGTGEREIPIPE